MLSKLIVADPSKQTKLSENGYSDASDRHNKQTTVIIIRTAANCKQFQTVTENSFVC